MQLQVGKNRVVHINDIRDVSQTKNWFGRRVLIVTLTNDEIIKCSGRVADELLWKIHDYWAERREW